MPTPNPVLLAHLRARLQALQPRARHGVLPFGDPRVDGCFADGGLPLGGLHEIAADGIEAETGAVAAGFLTALLTRLPGHLVWIAPQADLYAPGLLTYGLDPGRLVLVQTRTNDETLAAMEAALRESSAASVVAETEKLGRLASRRLQLACLKHGGTGFVLRRWPHGRKLAGCKPAGCKPAGCKTAGAREDTASMTRWRIAPAPSAAVPSAAVQREPGAPRWRVELEYARGGLEGAWIMEVEPPDATYPLRVVAELADAAAAPAPRQRSASGSTNIRRLAG